MKTYRVAVKSFEKGAVVTSSNEEVYQESTGKVYSWFTDATDITGGGFYMATSWG